MKLFRLNRKIDASGVSGTGIVAEGVELSDGRCVIAWLGKYPTIEILPNVESVNEIHGHHGMTLVEWVSQELSHV